jgi:hypothetical protein
MRSSLATALRVVLLLSCIPASNAFVILSRQSTHLALGTLLDPGSMKMVTSGVRFRGEFSDITLEGQSDTDCYIAVGDIRGFDRKLFESPQMCMNFDIFRGAEASLNLPQGVVVGIQGSQANVFSVNFYGDFDKTQISNPINLPFATFPVALSTDPFGGVYVALHETKGAVPPSASEESTELKDVVEYLKTMTYPKHSIVESPQLIKVNITSREVLWQKTLDTEEGRSTIGGIQYLPTRNLLVVVGSSYGQGSAVGAGVASQDWDGYVTIVDASTGQIDDSAAALTPLAAEHSVRITSQPGQQDFIHGVCALGDKVFLLGSTTGKIEGDISGGGFIMKIDVDTLNVLWKRQFVGQGVEAMKCTGAQDFIYVAGYVPAGVLLDDPTRKGRVSNDQDIFAALVSTETGDVQWTRQIDSRREDLLTDLVINQLGNLMVTGNAADFDAGISDLYILSLVRQTGFHDWQELSPDADPIGGETNSGNGSTLPPAIDNTGGTGTFEEIVDDEDNKTTVIVVAVVVPVVLALLVAIYAITTNRSKKQQNALAEAQEESVMTGNEPPPAPSPGVV